MSSLLFLGLAALVFLIGSGLVMFFYREKHATFEASIDHHQQRMDALSGKTRGRRRR